MTMFHAVAWVDHQSAQILQFDAEHIQAQKVKAHSHHTRQHGSSVRTEHEYFAEVCDALAGVSRGADGGPEDRAWPISGTTSTSTAPALGQQIVGWEAQRPHLPRTSWWRWRASTS